MGCDIQLFNTVSPKSNFNPRSPSGLRPVACTFTANTIFDFNPRSPSGLRHKTPRGVGWIAFDFNPRSPSGLRPDGNTYGFDCANISIHAARVGCDCFCQTSAGAACAFQSTQPEWAATTLLSLARWTVQHFNPRSPNGLRLYMTIKEIKRHEISIHAARMGCDICRSSRICRAIPFQSTQPEWAATVRRKQKF